MRRAPQMPRCPSPITSLGHSSPRRLMSLSTSDQLSMDSLYPGNRAHHHLPSVAQGRHHHQDRRLLPLKTGLDVDSIHPHVHHFQVIQGPSAPLGKLIVPLILQPGYRARRYRRPLLPAVPAPPGRSHLRKGHVGTTGGSAQQPSWSLLTNSGSSRLSNSSSVLRTRGLLSCTVPELSVSLRGLPYPFL